MPPRKKTETVTTDAKAVLDLETVAKDIGTNPQAPAVDEPKPDETQTTEEHDNNDELALLRAELAAAKEQLAARESFKEPDIAQDHRPKADSELTPEELEIRNLKDQLAKVKGQEIDKGEDVYEENTEGGILVHFLEDGVTSNGRNFYRGQEVTFGPEAYAETIDRNGNSWINLTDDEQYDRWGSVKFRKGPWPGRRNYEEESLKNVSITEQAPLTRI